MTDQPTALNSIRRATLTVAETAALLRVSEDVCRRAIDDGEIPSLRLGRRILVPTAKLLAMLGSDPAGGSPAGTPDEAERAAMERVESLVDQLNEAMAELSRTLKARR